MTYYHHRAKICLGPLEHASAICILSQVIKGGESSLTIRAPRPFRITVTTEFVSHLLAREDDAVDLYRLIESRQIKLHISNRLLDSALLEAMSRDIAYDLEWVFEAVGLMRTIGEHPSGGAHITYSKAGEPRSLATDIVEMFADEQARQADRSGAHTDELPHIDFVVCPEWSEEYAKMREKPFEREGTIWVTPRQLYLLVVRPEEYIEVADFKDE